MTPDQREAELRRRDSRFRTMTPAQRVALSAQEYSHKADCSFLLALVAELRRVIAHAPTAPAPVPAIAERQPTLPTAPTIPPPPLERSHFLAPRPPSSWDDPANRG